MHLTTARAFLVLWLFALMSWVPQLGAQLISEFVADHVGSDDHEYIEIYSGPGQTLSRHSILVVEGDAGGNPGRIDQVYTMRIMNECNIFADGFESGDTSAWSQCVDAAEQTNIERLALDPPNHQLDD